LPAGGQVAAGNVTATFNGAQLTLDQASRAAIMNWQSFNIAPNERVRILQPGADAALLARVTGGDPTALLGSLQADGKLFLINPRGILVGQGAVIDTAAFLASTLDVADADFLKNGPLTFEGDSAASIVNLGTITAREGNVLLLAHTVKNAGAIVAPNGTAGLAAGTEVWLASPDAPDFVVKTNLAATTEKTGVENSGTIAAAQAQLEAAGGGLYDLAVNQSGVVRATGVVRQPDGRVLLTADGGSVAVTGTIAARDADGAGGEILIGGDQHGGNPAIANAARTTIGPAAVLDASAASATASGGRVMVWADDTTRFEGLISAAGATGGFAEVSGKRSLAFHPAGVLDLGPGGNLLLDPDEIYIGTTDPDEDGVSFISTADLAAQLATTGTTVTLDTSTAAIADTTFGNITFAADLAWDSDAMLNVKAGNSIYLQADITASDGNLALYAGRRAIADPDFGIPGAKGEIVLDLDKTLVAAVLGVGLNPDANLPDVLYNDNGPPETGSFDFEGTLQVATLAVDLSANGRIRSLNAGTADSDIGTFKTTDSAGDIGDLQIEDGTGNLDVQAALTDSAARRVKIVTSGDLTLKAGTAFSFADPDSTTDVTLASTGGRFVNEAGASAVGTNGRFLIYSSSVGATVKDGLDGTEIYEHPYDSSEFFTDDASRFFYRSDSSLPTLTYTADDKTRTYGMANPTLTATRTGLVDGVMDDVTGAPDISTAATTESGVNTFAIAITQGSLVSDNYSFAFTAGSLEITPAPLTITALDAARTPFGADPDFKLSYSGFVLGQNEGVLSGLTVHTETDATDASPVGTYAIAASGPATWSNYAITYKPGHLTITDTSPLTITADDFSRLYGEDNPDFTASYAGFIGRDTASIVEDLEFATSATTTSGVRTYEIRPFGATAPGYVIDYVSGSLAVTPAPLTIAAQPATRTYGDANPVFTPVFSGLVAGDGPGVVTGLAVGTTATPASGVGDYPITVTGGTADNYTLTRRDSALHITPAALVVRADDASRYYGDADPAFTLTGIGLKNDDTLANSVFVTMDPYTLASDRAPIGNYAIQGDVAARNNNYRATFQSGTLTVRPRPLTIAADNRTRVYGDPNPAFTATFDGLASFDSSSVITGLSFSTPATQASGASTFGIFVSSDANSNYDITYQPGQLTINPAPLTFLPLGDLSRVYGLANPDPALPAVTGLKLTDTAQGLGLSYTFPALTAGAGDYTYALTTTNPNYTFAAGTGAFHVTPAPLTVQLGGGGRLYGEENPADYGARAQGLVAGFGDTLDSVLRVDNPADPTAPAGTYQLTAALLSPNYYLAGVSEGAFVVRPRQLTVDIHSIARYYGDPTPDFSWTIGGDGLASFDNESAVFLGVQTAVPVTLQTDAGLYRLDPVYVANPNYLVSWWPGWLAILPRPIEIKIHNAVVFGNNNIPFGFDAGDGSDVLLYDAEGHPTGYRVDVTNLPSFTTAEDFATGMTFALSDTNAPSAVGADVTPASYVFPTRPAEPTPLQATTDPLPAADLPDATDALPAFPTIVPNAAPSFEILTYTISLTDESKIDYSSLLLDSGKPAPADPTKDKFPDLIRFITPQSYGAAARNYTVTKVTNGALTMKADPIEVQRWLVQWKAEHDRQMFYQSTPETATGPVAFNLPRNLIQSIRDAVGFALAQEMKNLTMQDKDSLTMLIGGTFLSVGETLSETTIMAWLADIHTNPAKQAILMPWLISYTTSLAASTDQAHLTDTQKQFLQFITPSLQAARTEYVDNLKAAQMDWVAAQGEVGGRGTSLYGLFDGKVPYQDFISKAVTKTMGTAMDSYQRKQDAINANILKAEISIGGGAVAGAGTAIFGNVALSSANAFKVMFPGLEKTITKGIKKAAIKAGEKIVTEVVKKTASQAAAKIGSSAVGAVGSIVAFAVTTIISESFAVAENERQQTEFQAILDSRDDPVDPHRMMGTESGKSIMLLGLTNLFMGGN
jgi:filamentous hemagglutinin family protein